jgi:hypothetical protein
VSRIGRFTVVDVAGVVFWVATRYGLVGGNNGSEECEGFHAVNIIREWTQNGLL